MFLVAHSLLCLKFTRQQLVLTVSEPMYGIVFSVEVNGFSLPSNDSNIEMT